MSVIETRGLTKVYGRKRAVDNLDMRVAGGDIYGFVGKNGAGKSTTLKMIAGLATPTAGDVVLFGGQSPLGHGLGSSFSRIGALIDGPGLLLDRSAMDNLMVKALAIGVADPRRQCAELLELVGLSDMARKKPKKFSLGMKQRLGLALALVGSPDLLLLDEPFNGLDPEATRNMRNMLMRLNRERGVTVVVSSHVLDQLHRMANRFGVIADGRMVRELTEVELEAACGDSVRVRTTDPSIALAVLEQALPGVDLRMDADHAIVITAASVPGASFSASVPGVSSAASVPDASFAAVDPVAGASPATSEPSVGVASMEQIAQAASRALHDADQVLLELSTQRRDIEDYFLELMGGDDRA